MSDIVTTPPDASVIAADMERFTSVFQNMSFSDMLNVLTTQFGLSDENICALMGTVPVNLAFWRDGKIPGARRYTTLRSLCVLLEVVAQSDPDVATWLASYPVSREPFTRANVFTAKGATPLLDDLLGRFLSPQSLIDTVFVGWAGLSEDEREELRNLYALSFPGF